MVDITDAPNIINPGNQTVCGSYFLPQIMGTNLTGNESYWTAPNQGGSQLFEGDEITSNTTVYIYDGTPPCEDEESFEVTISAAPILDNPGNQTVCGSYFLPAITGTNLTGNESYWTATNQGGTQLFEGDEITSSMTIFIYDGTPPCEDEESFEVTISAAPILDNPGSQTVCGSYFLPAITGTNLTGNESYWTATNQGGSQLFEGDEITNNTTIFIYDGTPPCEDEVSFDIAISAAPMIDPIGPFTEDCSFILPAITGIDLSGNEAYYDMQKWARQ